MHYFDGLQAVGMTLAAEATKLLDHAKDLKEAIDRTSAALKLNYNEEDIAAEFEEDEDWINDFTEQFLDDCNKLTEYCVRVMKQCDERKHNLDYALIWGD
jgi:hypothetical protein